MKFCRLQKRFFNRPTLQVARELLGNYVVRKYRNAKIAGKIVETEAYIGPYDKASHAFGGKKTLRNAAEYMTGGHIYIYLVYGMHWQFNISTRGEGYAECVLIRALEPIANGTMNDQKLFIHSRRRLRAQAMGQRPRAQAMGQRPRAQAMGESENSRERLRAAIGIANGPGKLCRYLKLDKSFYAEDACRSKRIRLEDRGERTSRNNVVASARIGIDYAGPIWAKKPWRFYIKGNPFVSGVHKKSKEARNNEPRSVS
ncbi:MAG: hypothetical protein A2939_00735 [Parcubacteria group bacterium RIFCSPLOWO2_01_FULL_48_18]|nr:MAG: hypothetical protein A2939_00735 [Parcubacteria group bacterium RIFCSPLOWO2_01_FULL_48_18]